MPFESGGGLQPDTQMPPPRSITRRAFLATGAAAGIGLGVYSDVYGRHKFQITHLTMPVRDLPDAFQGFRFVQLSDIHLQEYTEAWFLEDMVRQVNALNPDLVLLTGDFVSRGPGPITIAYRAAGLCAEIISGLKAPQRFATIGNHDAVVGVGHVIPPFEAHGTPFLVDSYVQLERGSDHLWLCGLDDAGINHPDITAAIPSFAKAPVILMGHEPDFADQVKIHPRFPLVDLMLCGHSHGGQIRLPWVGPLILPPMGVKYIEGLFHFDHMKLYVNRGIGTVGLPFRFNCPAEITHFTLVRA